MRKHRDSIGAKIRTCALVRFSSSDAVDAADSLQYFAERLPQLRGDGWNSQDITDVKVDHWYRHFELGLRQVEELAKDQAEESRPGVLLGLCIDPQEVGH